MRIMLVLDGLQDTAYDELGGKTPYDAGKGEAFLRIEAASQTGTLRTTPPGFEADTQTCVLTLLGVEPEDIPQGRSYIEALALGLQVGDDDIIMRSNFVQIDEEGRLAVPCCSAPADVARALRAAIEAQPGHHVTPVGSYKSLQLIEGGRQYLRSLVTSTPHQNAMTPFWELLPYGNELARQLSAFSRAQYELHKPYTVLNWGAAVKSTLPAFSALHGGLRGAMVSKTDAPIGIAVAMGMECPNIPTATGDTDTDLAAKARATLELAARHDFVLLHVGGPDEATHRQNPLEKADFTRKMDAELIAPILDALSDGDRVMLTCDHIALCKTAGHTEDPVRFWLYEKGNARTEMLGGFPGTQAVALLCGK